MGTKYQYLTQPREHQLRELRRAWSKPHWAYFCDMGTGKSKIVIDEAGALYENGHITALLVVAPNDVVTNWPKEIALHMPPRIQRRIEVWESRAGKKKGAALFDLTRNPQPGKLAIFIINIEALSSDKGQAATHAFLTVHGGACYWVIDESSVIKHRTAKRTAFCINLRSKARFRRLLDGTPMPEGRPTELWSQCAFLDPAALGFENYYAFLHHFAVVQRVKMGPRSFNQVKGYRNLEELGRKLAAFSSIVKKEDCLDLPPKVYEQREVELTPEQKKITQQLEAEAWVELDKGTVSVTTALTLLLRLHQVACGYLPIDIEQVAGSVNQIGEVTDDLRMQSIPNKKGAALLQTLSQVGRKAIVWAPYKYILKELAGMIEKEHGAETVAYYCGETPKKLRSELVDRFQDPKDPLRFLVANKALARGVTLTQATSMIYYANGYSLGERNQSEDRAHRIGQDSRVTYVDLVAKGTVDERILGMHLSKQDLGSAVMDQVQVRLLLLGK